jgi:hypothetical protein
LQHTAVGAAPRLWLLTPPSRAACLLAQPHHRLLPQALVPVTYPQPPARCGEGRPVLATAARQLGWAGPRRAGQVATALHPRAPGPGRPCRPPPRRRCSPAQSGSPAGAASAGRAVAARDGAVQELPQSRKVIELSRHTTDPLQLCPPMPQRSHFTPARAQPACTSCAVTHLRQAQAESPRRRLQVICAPPATALWAEHHSMEARCWAGAASGCVPLSVIPGAAAHRLALRAALRRRLILR